MVIFMMLRYDLREEQYCESELSEHCAKNMYKELQNEVNLYQAPVWIKHSQT